MMTSEVSAAVWLLGALLLSGMGSAWAARLGEGSPRQTSYRAIFCGFLILVAAGTIAAIQLGPGYWLTSGSTFSLMVLTVTCDFSKSRRPAIAPAEG